MKVEISDNLKSLQTLIKKNEVEKESLKIKIKDIQKDIQGKDNNIKELNERIEKLKNKEIILSEHAILRYLERVVGINMEDVKKKIVTETLKEQYSVLGDGKYPIENEFFVRVKDNVIVTVLPIENK